MELTREEWINLIADAGKRFRVACAIAGYEQSKMREAVIECERAQGLLPSEVQAILIARGGQG